MEDFKNYGSRDLEDKSNKQEDTLKVKKFLDTVNNKEIWKKNIASPSILGLVLEGVVNYQLLNEDDTPYLYGSDKGYDRVHFELANDSVSSIDIVKAFKLNMFKLDPYGLYGLMSVLMESGIVGRGQAKALFMEQVYGVIQVMQIGERGERKWDALGLAMDVEHAVKLFGESVLEDLEDVIDFIKSHPDKSREDIILRHLSRAGVKNL
ncbi:MAG TPA: hypothetical protein PKZ29_02675 [Candidatus Woesebacteria bacterium]|nr:hypothetical protein [Candidatus Woesebacteria bacterium]